MASSAVNGFLASSYTFGDPALANLGMSNATIFGSDPLSAINQALTSFPEPLYLPAPNQPSLMAGNYPYQNTQISNAITNNKNTNLAASTPIAASSQQSVIPSWLSSNVFAVLANPALVVLGIGLILIAVYIMLGRNPINDATTIVKKGGEIAAA